MKAEIKIISNNFTYLYYVFNVDYHNLTNLFDVIAIFNGHMGHKTWQVVEKTRYNVYNIVTSNNVHINYCIDYL